MSSCREEDELLPPSSSRSFPHMSIYGLAIRHGSLVHRGSSSSIRPEQDIVSTEGAGSLLFSFVTPRPMKYFRVFTHNIVFMANLNKHCSGGEPHPRRNNKSMNNVDLMLVWRICLFCGNQSSETYGDTLCVSFIMAQSRYIFGYYETNEKEN